MNNYTNNFYNNTNMNIVKTHKKVSANSHESSRDCRKTETERENSNGSKKRVTVGKTYLYKL